MNKIHIDFAPRTFWRAVVMTRPLASVLVIIGVALCIGDLFSMRDLQQQYRIHQSELEKLHAQVSANRLRISTPERNSISEAQANALNRAIEQLNLPWGVLMDSIERATPATVALIELVPDAKRHVLKGVAEAKTSDLMIAFIGRLKQQSSFSNVTLTKHDINDQDTARPFRFEFEAEWREDVQ